jgi:hypothetical protein
MQIAETIYMYTHFGVLDTTLCGKVYQQLTTGQWFSPAPQSSTFD